MPQIGVRELKIRASEIVRALRETKARYLVTYRGTPIGLLTPLSDGPHPEAMESTDSQAAWDELVALGEEIGAGWTSEETGAEILSSMRR